MMNWVGHNFCLLIDGIGTVDFNIIVKCHIKPFIFSKKYDTKKLSSNTHLFWNLSQAKFGFGLEPHFASYVALIIDNVMTLLVGHSPKKRTPSPRLTSPRRPYSLSWKRNIRARFIGEIREIHIDYGYKVLQIKRLKWKFRENERTKVNGFLRVTPRNVD
ncbi:hypothetical protein RJT34_25171 [Clitoria ternatea]|uniref:Uncharacterized protein n=1 Tax=Clitoria ternatea TaxID=43366 RepID=A0AAN9FPF4_CLITE